MTNAEKFKEVFGIEPDIEILPLICPDNVEFCKYCTREEGCNCRAWWTEEYGE